jgi:ABC-2 type transport system ATP-binding protein
LASPVRCSAGPGCSSSTSPPTAWEGIRWLRELLRDYVRDGNSVSSHLLSEVAQTVDDLVIIADGRTRAQCALRELNAPDLEDAFLELTSTMKETA